MPNIGVCLALSVSCFGGFKSATERKATILESPLKKRHAHFAKIAVCRGGGGVQRGNKVQFPFWQFETSPFWAKRKFPGV